MIFYCGGNRFHRASDLDIVLYLLKNLTREGLFNHVYADDKIVIVTKDLKFQEAVEREWGTIKQKLKRFSLNFNPGSILEQNSEIEILIHKIACKAYGTNATANRKCAIETLNALVNAQ